jgi:hypothetical protein
MEKTNFNSSIDLYKRIMVRIVVGYLYSILLIFIMPKLIKNYFHAFKVSFIKTQSGEIISIGSKI